MNENKKNLAGLIAKLTISFLLLSIVSNCTAALFERVEYFPEENLPQESRVPGGVAIIPFEWKSSETPEVIFRNNRVLVVNTGKYQWHAIVGLPLKLKPGEQTIEIKGGETPSLKTFEVVDKEFDRVGNGSLPHTVTLNH